MLQWLLSVFKLTDHRQYLAKLWWLCLRHLQLPLLLLAPLSIPTSCQCVLQEATMLPPRWETWTVAPGSCLCLSPALAIMGIWKEWISAARSSNWPICLSAWNHFKNLTCSEFIYRKKYVKNWNTNNLANFSLREKEIGNFIISWIFPTKENEYKQTELFGLILCLEMSPWTP